MSRGYFYRLSTAATKRPINSKTPPMIHSFLRRVVSSFFCLSSLSSSSGQSSSPSPKTLIIRPLIFIACLLNAPVRRRLTGGAP